MHCNICKSLSNFIFKKRFLQKYDVSLFRCTNCGFIQTEKPYWLDEAYRLPFTPLDVNLASRPVELGQLTENLLLNYFKYDEKFLDYGGGIGLFTRIMRDRGLDFYRQDKYAQNLFSQYFDLYDLPLEERSFELVTCFEVLEHLENPLQEIDEMFSFSKNIFCSTQLQPMCSIEELQSWSYIAEIHGQHISFFTKKAMQIIAEKFNCFYYEKYGGLHLFSKKEIGSLEFSRINTQKITFPYRIKQKIIRLVEEIYKNRFQQEEYQHPLKSLAERDTEWVTNKLKGEVKDFCK